MLPHRALGEPFKCAAKHKPSEKVYIGLWSGLWKLEQAQMALQLSMALEASALLSASSTTAPSTW